MINALEDLYDSLDAPTRTLAEFLFECGYPPNRAMDMAWCITKLPETTEEFDAEVYD